MPPNKPQTSYSKRPIKRIKLLKFGQQQTKGLFEEYFHGFVVAITLIIMILGKAGGLDGYDAVVTGLWVGGFIWCASLVRRYQKEKSGTGEAKKSKPEVPATDKSVGKPLSPNFKPMIGPQWPLKTAPGAAQKSLPGQQGKRPVFVYERPTLPDRPAKFPANWGEQEGKKPRK